MLTQKTAENTTSALMETQESMDVLLELSSRLEEINSVDSAKIQKALMVAVTIMEMNSRISRSLSF